MRFLLVQPLEKKDESKQVLERLQSTRRTALECSSNWNVDGDLHLLFLVLLMKLSQKEEKSQDGAQMWIDISQNQEILE
ncbi:hypothetical protein HGM15179_020089 [Zosterops borbonicus]|uniref:Uncharacterized protein n=1 Tax=Zosterops borbonicus TaxID=364589 RepID=A0A8K1D9U8_9PASS|nr:hypothetical protein HGM15179_020089 [Zosterops borbonicus]